MPLLKSSHRFISTTIPHLLMKDTNLHYRHLFGTSNHDVSWLKTRRHVKTSAAAAPDNGSQSKKLIYEGKLENRIFYLKGISILSSMGLAGSYSYVIGQKGFSIALAGVGFAFAPFLMSPFLIAWFFNRYITRLYYNRDTDSFTAHHFGLLLNKKSCTFKSEDVSLSDVSMLNTFKVGKKPFFLHDEDLIDSESVGLYKKMVGLDRIKNGNKQ